jgi:hypothetical protein
MGGRKPGGPKTGGRKKGQRNLSNRTDVQAIVKAANCSPYRIMAQLANGHAPCSVCKGKGRTKYQPSRQTQLIDGVRAYVMPSNPESMEERVCLSCYGSGKEIVSPELRGRMAESLGRYLAPQLKAIEHTGEGGGPLEAIVNVRFIKASAAD